jgi:hypothetical protein
MLSAILLFFKNTKYICNNSGYILCFCFCCFLRTLNISVIKVGIFYVVCVFVVLLNTQSIPIIIVGIFYVVFFCSFNNTKYSYNTSWYILCCLRFCCSFKYAKYSNNTDVYILCCLCFCSFTTQNIPIVNFGQEVSSASNSECSYLKMAERPKYILNIYRKMYIYRSCADGNTSEYNWSFYTVNK